MESGYYWVMLRQNIWEIGRLMGDGKTWRVMANSYYLDKDDFIEIGPRIEQYKTIEPHVKQ